MNLFRLGLGSHVSNAESNTSQEPTWPPTRALRMKARGTSSAHIVEEGTHARRICSCICALRTGMPRKPNRSINITKPPMVPLAGTLAFSTVAVMSNRQILRIMIQLLIPRMMNQLRTYSFDLDLMWVSPMVDDDDDMIQILLFFALGQCMRSNFPKCIIAREHAWKPKASHPQLADRK